MDYEFDKSTCIFLTTSKPTRLKPHAIRFHPDTTLNVIYKTKSHITQQ